MMSKLTIEELLAHTYKIRWFSEEDQQLYLDLISRLEDTEEELEEALDDIESLNDEVSELSDRVTELEDKYES